MPANNGPRLLGPFVGFVTDATAKIWMHRGDLETGASQALSVQAYDPANRTRTLASAPLTLKGDELGTGIAELGGLSPDTVYSYRILDVDEKPIDLEGLEEADLHFRTLPKDGDTDRLDFLLMSCHNPTSCSKDGHKGYRVWSRLPKILAENEDGPVRFAIMAGDQIYADEARAELLKSSAQFAKEQIYLGVYRRFWSHLSYRKVLCSLPSVLMWDDHDIMDGWGSDDASFKDDTSKEFKNNWLSMYAAAERCFKHLQSARNPTPLTGSGFDVCFRIGRAAFVLVDLRSKRNLRIPRIWNPAQWKAVKDWIQAERESFDTLFFVSPVVFSHGDPDIDEEVVKSWGPLLDLMKLLKKTSRTEGNARKLVDWFDEHIGDLRDDIRDSWGAEANARETEKVLDFLFELQNPPEGTAPVKVVILCGDIHAAGYSTLYSKSHETAVIPHVVSSPVAYSPFQWILEAIYRANTTSVQVGSSGNYYAQISHHFCSRNVAVLSLRRFKHSARDQQEEVQLKVKYYLEDHPEPQILIFDLNRSSHREEIGWEN